MSLCTVSPKNADALYNRLTEIERMMFRAATPGQLEHLRCTEFASDGPPSEQTMQAIQTRLLREFSENSKKPGFGLTWKF